jgi:hypothetical protein
MTSISWSIKLDKAGGLVRDKHSSLSDTFVSYEEIVVNIAPGAVFTRLDFICNLITSISWNVKLY